MTVIFAGQQLAKQELNALKKAISGLARPPQITTLCFKQDPGSVFYTQEKQAAAAAVGLKFRVEWLSFAQPLTEVILLLKQLATDKDTTGIMVQKPIRTRYNEYFLSQAKSAAIDFNSWWRTLTAAIAPEKDVDGLTQNMRERIKRHQTAILPATVKAVLKAAAASKIFTLKFQPQILIIGRTDLLGLPLAYYWRARRHAVTLVGRQELGRLLAQTQKLRSFDLIVSATGVPNLITGDLIRSGVVLIDVGWPKGDLDFNSCAPQAAFITPVPGGIGPLTVVSLLENVLELRQLSFKAVPQSHLPPV